MRTAKRSRIPVALGTLLPLALKLVALDLGDAHAGEAARGERAVAQVDDAVDLGSLSGRAGLPGERGVFARPVDEHVERGAEELLLALPRDGLAEVLHARGALSGDLSGHLVGEVGRRRPFL